MFIVLLIVFSFLTEVYSVSKNEARLLSDTYLTHWAQGNGAGLISDASTEATVRSATKCFEFQRVIISKGTATFLSDPFCGKNWKNTIIKSNDAVRRQKAKLKFLVYTQKHFSNIAKACGDQLNFVDIVVNLRDEPVLNISYYKSNAKSNSNTYRLAPVFSFQTTTDHVDIPIDYSIDSYDEQLRRFVSNYTSSLEFGGVLNWDNRVPILFWRGTQTGGRYERHNWHKFARSKLVLYCKKHPDVCDAGFTAYTQVTPRSRKRIEAAVGLKDQIPMSKQWRYKYLASLDGNGWASRLPYLMALGSAVFKQESKYNAWWYPLLKKDEHYFQLPSTMDDTDIATAISWARQNDIIVQKVAKAGQQFVIDKLQYEASENTYMCTLLAQYEKLTVAGRHHATSPATAGQKRMELIAEWGTQDITGRISEIS